MPNCQYNLAVPLILPLSATPKNVGRSGILSEGEEERAEETSTMAAAVVFRSPFFWPFRRETDLRPSALPSNLKASTVETGGRREGISDPPFLFSSSPPLFREQYKCRLNRPGGGKKFPDLERVD